MNIMMSMGSTNNVHVLVTGKLALALPAACCSADARERSPYVLSVQVLQTRAEANVTCLEWHCRRNCATTHSQWFCMSDVAFVQQVADANAALGRGAHEAPFEAENSHRIALWTSPALGRFTVASERIAAGTCALKATAFAVAIKQQLVRTHCHWCFTALSKKALQCGACVFARYCSRDCLDTDAVLHASQCPALAQLQKDRSARHLRTWTDAGVDVETIRLALAVLSMERFVGSTAPLARLVTHAQATHARASVLDAVARFVLSATRDGPASAGAGGDSTPALRHVRQTLVRVQCNAHPLSLNGAVTVGVGVFPDAAMALNHSCLPSVVPSFDPKTRSLAFHAIRTIHRGQAVEYAYVDVLQATARRQDALLDGFGFQCVCWRCAQEPAGAGARDDEDAAALATHELLALERQAPTASSCALAQAAAALLERHRSAFARSPELLVALHTLQLQVAGARSDWPRVLASAQTLEQLWREHGLPDTYPTLEVLARQIERAAAHMGDLALARDARTRAAAIRQTCGYRSS